MKCLLASLLLASFFHFAAASEATAWDSAGKVETQWGDVSYRTAGEGPPLLLLHGYFGNGAQWGSFLSGFSHHYTVIAPDLLGHGDSTIEGNEFRAMASAEAIWAMLDTLNIRRIRGIGYSAGGITLLQMAVLRPDSIDAMVLSASSHLLAAEPPRTRWEDFPEAFQSDMLRNHPRGLPQIRKLISMKMIGNMEDKDLRAVSAATLMLSGDRDEIFPPDAVLQTYNALPNASLWIVPNLGHALYWPWGGNITLAREFPLRAVQFFEDNNETNQFKQEK